MQDGRTDLTETSSPLRSSSARSPIKLALLGFGNVGRAFAEYTINDRLYKIRAVADSSGAVVLEDHEQLSRLIAHKDSGGRVTELESLSRHQTSATGEALFSTNDRRDDAPQGTF